NGSQLKNFRRATDLSLQCATATQDSLFSISKGSSMVTMPWGRPLPSPEADCSFQDSLPTPLVCPQTLIHWPETFVSARGCDRFKSIILLGAKPNRWSCHRCNMPSVPDCQTSCPAPM